MTVRKIESGRIITVKATDWVGPVGTIFYEEDTGDLRLGDGVTPGGILLYPGGGGGGTGYAGSRGYTGSQGFGYTGSAGGIGYTGSQGYVGSRGADGFIGRDGYTGSSGYTGSQGFTGYTGSGGLGYTGSVGYVGSAGSTYLSGLLDVDIITSPPLDKQVLAYSTVTNKWDAQDMSAITLLPATTSTLGGIKVGTNLSITIDGTLSASGSPNIDGGYPTSVYGGTPSFDGGTP